MLKLPTILENKRKILESFLLPCVGFELSAASPAGSGVSRLGWGPDLPRGFVWPEYRSRKLDFLLQVSLADVAGIPESRGLPADGLLSFFYDLEEQPWGFDPKQSGAFKVAYTPAGTALEPLRPPDKKFALEPHALKFQGAQTLPSFGSRDYDRLNEKASFTDEETEAYHEIEIGERDHGHSLLGHSANIQGDMQLEAQLVSHGLYCGDPKGYQDPRARALEAGAEDWLLLLQLDSDDNAGLMWGDGGMLYFWIRRQDLARRDFTRTWLGLQCF